MTLPTTRELTEEQLMKYMSMMGQYESYKELVERKYRQAQDYFGECLVKCRAKQMEEAEIEKARKGDE